MKLIGKRVELRGGPCDSRVMRVPRWKDGLLMRVPVGNPGAAMELNTWARRVVRHLQTPEGPAAVDYYANSYQVTRQGRLIYQHCGNVAEQGGLAQAIPA